GVDKNLWFTDRQGKIGKVLLGLPVKATSGDFDGDGQADLTVFRPSNGFWSILASTAGRRSLPFGTAVDLPLNGDFDGDGRADLAVYRPTTGQWLLQQSTAGLRTVTFGFPNVDLPIP